MQARTALLSVTDKSGIVELGRGLLELGFELIATGGTARVLRQAGLEVRPLEELTGFPEILDGRLKTLHPGVFGGLLARPGERDLAALAQHGIAPIELLACNLYRFEHAAARDASWQELLEQIDIGGPAMIRAAAKNCERVAVLVDPADYPHALAELRAHGQLRPESRRALARKAFARTAAYEATIATVLAARPETAAAALGAERAAGTETPFPERLTRTWSRACALRYGENPHQRAALYVEPLLAARAGGAGGCAGSTAAATPAPALALARPLQGKPLSYNNLLDAQAALALVRELAALMPEQAAACVIKHTNPCGAALGHGPAQALERALAGDPLSAFGGIVGLSQPLDPAAAELLRARFLELVLAPGCDPRAQAVLATKPELRVLLVALAPPPSPNPVAAEPPGAEADWELRPIEGGLLVQERDRQLLDERALRPVTARVPSPAELADLRFAWAVCKHVRSNAIVIARDAQVLGVGAGQMSRVDAVALAIRKAGPRARGAVLASDAFFPFPDAIELAASAGIRALIQPGGSRRDPEVIAAAEAAGLAMVLTGMRHFRH
ncbi:MAG: bifunctional purine biosynthesis protein PurH [Planctomycetota bacterium]|nr:MAG: bifunctional purine biosynthesis protein PurH [Planctomycetota bacterium]